jgi:AbrB family looped-hinge helix DNA binding protein
MLPMQKTTVSSKGQVVIPRGIRTRHGWTPGTALEIEEHGDSLILRPVRKLPRTSLADLVGCTGYKGPPMSLEDMESGVAEGARQSR